MNKQKRVVELLIYLVALIFGIALLINGYHKKGFDISPNETSGYTEQSEERR